jgi:hypothetical protein
MNLRRVALLAIAFAALTAPDALALGESDANGFPNWAERVYHQWTNRARANPATEMASCGANCSEAACYTPQQPLPYDVSVGRSARFHSDEMVQQGYFNHPSICTLVSNINALYPATCNGSASCACQTGTTTCGPSGQLCTDTFTRIGLFNVPDGEFEIIAQGFGGDPDSLFYLWLYEPNVGGTCAFGGSNGHRWSILQASGAVGYGASSSSATGDFRFVGPAPAKIPSGTHYPRQSAAVGVWASWFDTAGPSVARVNVDGVCTPMTLAPGRGTAANGTWTATLTTVASGCHNYYFDFKDSLGNPVTYPTTGSLVIGAAGVCPDFSATRPPACPISLTAVKSRKTHGAAGTFDLAIDTTQPIGGAVTVEPREIGTGHLIVFQFSGAVTAPGTVSSTAGAATAAMSGNEVRVTLTGIADNSRATVSLANVNNAGVNVSASLGFLLGDVNSNRALTASDIAAVKGKQGSAVNASTFIYDADTSGTIGAADVADAKGKPGSRIP